MNYDILLLQSLDPQMMSIILWGGIFLVIWLFMIRPQVKRQRDGRKFITAIQKGDEVVTTSGIIGKITKIEEKIVTLEIGSKSYLRVMKSAVSKEMTEEVFNDKAEK